MNPIAQKIPKCLGSGVGGVEGLGRVVMGTVGVDKVIKCIEMITYYSIS